MQEKILVPAEKNLLPFQVDAVQTMLKFLTSSVKGCYNACEMGLGKTVQTIVCINTLELRKICIVCPAVVRGVWKCMLSEWLVYRPGHISLITSAKDVKEISKSDIVIISYELAAKYVDLLSSTKWDCLIVDEAHKLKNYKAKRTKAILKKLWPVATYKIALSGTPFTVNVVDGYTLFHSLCPKVFTSYFSFADKYAFLETIRIRTSHGLKIIKKYVGLKNGDLLKQEIRSRFYVRYKKEEVLPELPDKIYQKIELQTKIKRTKEEQTNFERTMTDFIATPDKTALTESFHSVRQAVGLSKVPLIVEFLEDIFEPVVIFAYHISVLQALKEALSPSHKISYIDGSVPNSVRDSEVSKFQNGETSIFLGQVAAAGIGITLTSASICIIAETVWTPAEIDQAVDRLHRIGQKNAVTVYYMTDDSGFDEKVLEVLQTRRKEFKEVLDG